MRTLKNKEGNFITDKVFFNTNTNNNFINKGNPTLALTINGTPMQVECVCEVACTRRVKAKQVFLELSKTLHPLNQHNR